LRGKDEGGVFVINNTNAGTYKAASASTPANIAGFGNLTGGTGSDIFNITTDSKNSTTGALTGKIDAGGGSAIDVLSYAGYAPNTTGANPIVLTLTSLTGTGTATATGTGTGITGGFSGIESLIGNDSLPTTSNTTLSSFGSANWTWNVTGLN